MTHPYDEQVEEQPRCRGCGHRRIHHFVGIERKGVMATETPVPCSRFTSVATQDRCGCPSYEPMTNLRVIR